MKVWKIFVCLILFAVYKMGVSFKAGGDESISYAIVYFYVAMFCVFGAIISHAISADIEEGTNARRIGVGIFVVWCLYSARVAIVAAVMYALYELFKAYA